MPDALLSVRDLRISFPGPRGRVTALSDLSFDIQPGECVALTGPSGSGKTTAGLAILRLVEFHGGRIEGGSILFRDPEPTDLLHATPRALRALRGDRIAMVFQEPATALNPVLTIGAQLAEVLARHRNLPPRLRQARALELLEQVQLPDPARRLRQYPHQLSGGMRQRAMIAMGMACNPRLLICDEPTTALDTVTQSGILTLIDRLRREHGMAVLLITHDMAVVRQLQARVIAMPHHPLPALTPATPRQPAPAMPPLLQVRGLNVDFPQRQGLRGSTLHAVRDLDLDLYPGQTLALVGRSGCGKTSAARAMLRLGPVRAGQVWLDGRDLMALAPRELRHARRDIQMVFQDPDASLDPQMRLGDQVAEPLANHRIGTRPERAARVAALFQRTGLPLALIDAYPHQISGGQRQRVAIARALAAGPRVLIADEPVSSLDAPVRARVLDLLAQLQRDLGLAILFISHDMAAVARIADRIAVMDQGRIVQTGTLAQVLAAPDHPATRALLAASDLV